MISFTLLKIIYLRFRFYLHLSKKSLIKPKWLPLENHLLPRFRTRESLLSMQNLLFYFCLPRQGKVCLLSLLRYFHLIQFQSDGKVKNHVTTQDKYNYAKVNDIYTEEFQTNQMKLNFSFKPDSCVIRIQTDMIHCSQILAITKWRMTYKNNTNLLLSSKISKSIRREKRVHMG